MLLKTGLLRTISLPHSGLGPAPPHLGPRGPDALQRLRLALADHHDRRLGVAVVPAPAVPRVAGVRSAPVGFLLRQGHERQTRLAGLADGDFSKVFLRF